MQEEQKNENSWGEWGKHVILSLEKIDERVEKLEDKINKQREETIVEIATLKAKAGVWGSIAGVIASLVTSLIVGLLVYSFTQGSIRTDHSHPEFPPQPSGAQQQVLPPREDPLAGFNLREDDDIV